MKKLLIIGAVGGLLIEGLAYLMIDASSQTANQTVSYFILVAYLLMGLVAISMVPVMRAPRFIWRWGLVIVVLLVSELTRYLVLLLLHQGEVGLLSFAQGRLEMLLVQLPILLGLSLVSTIGWYLKQLF